MENEEKRDDESKVEERCCDTFCFAGQGDSKMVECCKSMLGAGDWRSMMSKCMKGCRWFPLIPVVLGIWLFLLGYYLDAEIARVLWMVVAASVILMGAVGLVVMRVMIRKMTIQSK